MHAAPASTIVVGLSTLSRGVVIAGDVACAGSLVVECMVHGSIWCEGNELVVAAGAHVTGDIVARDVTIEGRVDGQIIATEMVDVRAGATLSGRVIAKRFILEPDATVHARVEPQHLDTAIRVARFQQQKRNAAG